MKNSLSSFFCGAFLFLNLTGLLNPLCANGAPEIPVQIHVAISTNLPEETIRSLTSEAKKYKARSVLRGIPLTKEEVEILESRGHFSEEKSIQEENRAILRRGFKRLNDLAQNGIVLEVDPPFFRDHKIDAVPTIVFNWADEVITLSGISSIAAALQYAIGNVKSEASPDFVKALCELEGESP